MIRSAIAMYGPLADEYKKIYERSDLRKRIESHDKLIAERDYNQLCNRLPSRVRSKAITVSGVNSN